MGLGVWIGRWGPGDGVLGYILYTLTITYARADDLSQWKYPYFRGAERYSEHLSGV